MKVHFALCDDEVEQLNILHEIITQISGIKGYEVTIDTYASGSKLVHAFQHMSHPYDLVFLDMQMPEIDGIETGKGIRELNKDVIIIYITGFVDFAINAFEIRAFDYILKPVDTKKLEKALEEALAKIEATHVLKAGVDDLLILNYDKKIVSIKQEDVIYLEKSENKVVVVCKDCKYEIYDSLNNMKKKLNEHMFLQTHQGFIINKKKICRYENQQVALTQEYVIPVSKKNINLVKKAFFESLRG